MQTNRRTGVLLMRCTPPPSKRGAAAVLSRHLLSNRPGGGAKTTGSSPLVPPRRRPERRGGAVLPGLFYQSGLGVPQDTDRRPSGSAKPPSRAIRRRSSISCALETGQACPRISPKREVVPCPPPNRGSPRRSLTSGLLRDRPGGAAELRRGREMVSLSAEAGMRPGQCNLAFATKPAGACRRMCARRSNVLPRRARRRQDRPNTTRSLLRDAGSGRSSHCGSRRQPRQPADEATFNPASSSRRRPVSAFLSALKMAPTKGRVA